MGVEEIKKRKEILKQNIINELASFSEETGLKIQEGTIQSFYDVRKLKGKHNINIYIKNPF